MRRPFPIAAWALPDVTMQGTAPTGCLVPSLPLDHQRLLQAVDSLGQRVELRWLYRQMYRHFEWHPLAQLSPSIEIYREQSARPRWLAFEVYRGLSILRTRSLTREQTIGPSRRDQEDLGIKRVKSLSHRVFAAIFLPSQRYRSHAAPLA